VEIYPEKSRFLGGRKLCYEALIEKILNDEELDSDLTEDILFEVYNSLKNSDVEVTAC
jgi:hypothetical protein